MKRLVVLVYVLIAAASLSFSYAAIRIPPDYSAAYNLRMSFDRSSGQIDSQVLTADGEWLEIDPSQGLSVVTGPQSDHVVAGAKAYIAGISAGGPNSSTNTSYIGPGHAASRDFDLGHIYPQVEATGHLPGRVVGVSQVNGHVIYGAPLFDRALVVAIAIMCLSAGVLLASAYCLYPAKGRTKPKPYVSPEDIPAPPAWAPPPPAKY